LATPEEMKIKLSDVIVDSVKYFKLKLQSVDLAVKRENQYK
jgi:hypothetical protein